jgi:hypothetical protein
VNQKTSRTKKASKRPVSRRVKGTKPAKAAKVIKKIVKARSARKAPDTMRITREEREILARVQAKSAFLAANHKPVARLARLGLVQTKLWSRQTVFAEITGQGRHWLAQRNA